MVEASRDPLRGSGGRPVPPSRLHVTLVFLGAVGEADLPRVLAAAQRLVAAPFELCFDRVEHWPRPQVLVAVPSALPAAATQLAASLGAALARGAFEVESRPWRPHVTLARKVVRPAAGSTLKPVRWPVTALSLVESLAVPGGVRYAVIERWPLAAPGSPPEPPAPAD